MKLSHEFVKTMPEILEDGIIYVSIEYATAIHKCCCGCGNEVVTPISPTDWKLIYDGETISLYPSIGSWSLKCQSHYWITKNEVEWAPKWSNKQIKYGQQRDEFNKNDYFQKKERKSILKRFLKRE